jgi:hypothetical protein
MNYRKRWVPTGHARTRHGNTSGALSPRELPLATSILSGFRIVDGYISRKGFAHLPVVGDIDPGGTQFEGGLTSTRISPPQGDLVMGTIDATHERAYMLPAIRDEDHTEEKRAVVR